MQKNHTDSFQSLSSSRPSSFITEGRSEAHGCALHAATAATANYINKWNHGSSGTGSSQHEGLKPEVGRRSTAGAGYTHLAAKRRAKVLSAAARNASTSSGGGGGLPLFPLFGLRADDVHEH